MKLEGLKEDIEAIRVNIREDHVHLVIIPQRFSVARVMQYMKSANVKLKLFNVRFK